LKAKHKKKSKPIIPQPLRTINPNVAGIDIGSEEIYVAIPPDRDSESVRVFTTFTSELHELRNWLLKCNITSVAMESTGVYWIPLYDILETAGITVCLVNARHVKNVPGKKTDVLDCQWLQQLHSYGLLTSSFRPAEDIRQLRTIARQRDMLLRYRAAHVQHMQKALHEMNIQIDNVLNDITGATGFAILRAIVAGERDPHTLAQHRDPRCRSSHEVIVKSLEGTYLDEHLFELTQAIELYDFYSVKISECDNRLDALYKDITVSSHYPESPTPPAKAKKYTRGDSTCNLWDSLYRLCGIDLTRIHGFNALTVQTILTETGIDMDQWLTFKHFSSWLGLCPNNKITGGRVLTTTTKKTTNRATTAFRLAARSLHHSKSALGAYYRRVLAHCGPKIAIKATAHKLARIFYTMLKNHLEYQDLGERHYEQQYKDRTLRRLRSKATELGFTLMPIEVPALSTT
jgi:transposase